MPLPLPPTLLGIIDIVLAPPLPLLLLLGGSVGAVPVGTTPGAPALPNPCVPVEPQAAIASVMKLPSTGMIRVVMKDPFPYTGDGGRSSRRRPQFLLGEV
jgi:hypothetical protein